MNICRRFFAFETTYNRKIQIIITTSSFALSGVEYEKEKHFAEAMIRAQTAPSTFSKEEEKLREKETFRVRRRAMSPPPTQPQHRGLLHLGQEGPTPTAPGALFHKDTPHLNSLRRASAAHRRQSSVLRVITRGSKLDGQFRQLAGSPLVEERNDSGEDDEDDKQDVIVPTEVPDHLLLPKTIFPDWLSSHEDFSSMQSHDIRQINELRERAERTLKVYGLDPKDKEQYFQAKERSSNLRRNAARRTNFWGTILPYTNHQQLHQQHSSSNYTRVGRKSVVGRVRHRSFNRRTSMRSDRDRRLRKSYLRRNVQRRNRRTLRGTKVRVQRLQGDFQHESVITEEEERKKSFVHSVNGEVTVDNKGIHRLSKRQFGTH